MSTTTGCPMTGEVGVGVGVTVEEAVAEEVGREEGRVAVAVAEAVPVGKELRVGAEVRVDTMVFPGVEVREVLEVTVVRGFVGLAVPKEVLEVEGEGVKDPVAASVNPALPLGLGLWEPVEVALPPMGVEVWVGVWVPTFTVPVLCEERVAAGDRED